MMGSRQEFEKWYWDTYSLSHAPLNFDEAMQMDNEGNYNLSCVQMTYDGWQACQALNDAKIAELEEKLKQKLWLWKNFVDGKPEYWAFDNPFPIHLDSGDPQVLGEPCGYAIFKESRQGRTDVSEKEVLRCISIALDKMNKMKG